MASRIAARSTTHGTPVKSCSSTRAGVKAIVFSSTAAVYGEPSIVPITEDLPYAATTRKGKARPIAGKTVMAPRAMGSLPHQSTDAPG